jgi:hypothetical protein
MNKIETTSLMVILKTAYPNFYKNTDEIEDAINLWSMMFETDPAKIVIEAVKSLICTLKYPPTIADVKTKIYEISHPNKLTEMEAWNIVKKAVDNYSIYDYEKSRQVFDSLPDIVKRLLGGMSQLREYGQMDSETFNTVAQSNFMRSFKSLQAQEIERDMLPESTKKLILSLSERMALTDGSD